MVSGFNTSAITKGEQIMREGIHPQYMDCEVVCACGNTFKTRSTKPKINLEICSQCHPFFTGRQKLVDTAGRVERFQKRYKKTEGKTIRVAATTKKEKKVSQRTKKSSAKVKELIKKTVSEQ